MTTKSFAFTCILAVTVAGHINNVSPDEAENSVSVSPNQKVNILDYNRKNYYLSSTMTTADKVNERCKNFSGRLVTIQNKPEYDSLKQFLILNGIIGEHLWTAGRHNGTDWTWTTLGTIIQSSQLYWHPSSDHGGSNSSGSGHCLTLVGNVPTYGMCSSFRCSQYFRYICEVLE